MLALIFCFLSVISVAVSQPLPVEGQVAPFVLRNTEGKAFGLSDLSGKVWIADFIYTRCSDECPLLSARMAKLERALPKVMLVSFTIDPGYDTPKVLKGYAEHYGAVKGRWTFLTGDRSVIGRLGEKTFHLPVMPVGSRILAHSNLMILIDEKGRIRGYYDTSRPELFSRLVQDATRLAFGDRSH